MFISSCYWQPLPLDSSLSVPWAEDITTFAQALNSTLRQNYSQPFPDTIQTVDRCWCDFSTGGFFEPYNVTHWEHVTVQKLKDELEQEEKIHQAHTALADEKFSVESLSPTSPAVISTSGSSTSPTTSPPANTLNFVKMRSIAMDSIWGFISVLNGDSRQTLTPSSSPSPSSLSPTPTPILTDHSSIDNSMSTSQGTKNLPEKLPLFRRVYDLQPYGMSLSIDFGWTR